jgi:hypothetical protein
VSSPSVTSYRQPRCGDALLPDSGSYGSSLPSAVRTRIPAAIPASSTLSNEIRPFARHDEAGLQH